MKILAEMQGVRCYGEKLPVELAEEDDGRLVVRASNQAGFDSTCVDLLDLLAWLVKNRPDIILRTPIEVGDNL